MTVSNSLIERIVSQAIQLPFNERLNLIHRIIDTLPQDTEQCQFLVYGQFQGDRMSTEEDFRVAERRPTEAEPDGA